MRFMSSTRAAVVLGASGSVGNALIKELIRKGSFRPIVTLVRRSQPDQVAMARGAGVELRETLVPAMDPAGLEAATTEAIASLEGDVVGLSVLGVGAGTAKLTIDEHRAVDVQLNAAFARGLKATGRVEHLAFMSAAGADPTAAATGSDAAGMARYALFPSQDTPHQGGFGNVIDREEFVAAPTLNSLHVVCTSCVGTQREVSCHSIARRSPTTQNSFGGVRVKTGSSGSRAGGSTSRSR